MSSIETVTNELFTDTSTSTNKLSISEFIAELSDRGVQFSVDKDKLRINAPKGTIVGDLRSELMARKPEIIAFLQKQLHEENGGNVVSKSGLSLAAIGRIIGGFCSEGSASQGFKCPTIDAGAMASKLSVTFRPLPKGYKNGKVVQLRTQLRAQLEEAGVTIVSWQDATRDSNYEFEIPWLKKKVVPFKTRTVKADIDAVVDVERMDSPVSQFKGAVAEWLYQLYSHLVLKGRKLSAVKIARSIAWAEENVLSVEDPTNTQSIVLAEFDPKFGDPELSYQNKIPLGVGALVRTFSEIYIGVSDEQLYILNMNLSDSIYSTQRLEEFVTQSLIPKIFIPILPLPMSRFEIDRFDPTASSFAQKLVKMGQSLEPLGLLPEGFKIDDVVKKLSHRDIVDWISNGRTGVSYGFIAYVEPPQYFGPKEVSAMEWETLIPLKGLNLDEVRRNSDGRRYIKIQQGERLAYKQIPDIWLVSSRSGSKKTALDISRDVVRIGLTDRLHMQIPTGTNNSTVDVKPSYDLYVMVGIALSAALSMPNLVQSGAPIVHFHGYPSIHWYQPHEYFTGVTNPSVPCGTYESGVLNFLGVEEVAVRSAGQARLISLIEPDHGTNIVANDWEYLIERLKVGMQGSQIELGGKYLCELGQSAHSN